MSEIVFYIPSNFVIVKVFSRILDKVFALLVCKQLCALCARFGRYEME